MMHTANDIREAIAKHRDELMKIGHVVGVGLGKKASPDGKTRILCIKIYVAELTDRVKEEVPEIIDGIETDLFVSGEIKAQ